MSYKFYTREQIANTLSQIGNKELAERYLNNTSRKVVVTENPVKNSFEWSSTAEGYKFWKTISEAFDKAIASGKVSIIGDTIDEDEGLEILERNITHNPQDFLKEEFVPSKSGESKKDEDVLSFLKKKIDTEEKGWEDEEDEDGISAADKADSEEFAKEMMAYVITETIKRSLKKKLK